MLELTTSNEKISAKGPWAYVRRCDVETEHKSGLTLPQVQREKSIYCEMISPPEGEWVKGTFVKLQAKPGDRVVVRQFDGIGHKAGGGCLFVHQEMIEVNVADGDWPS